MTAKSSSVGEPSPLRRVALGIEYDGSQYHGWQIQRRPPVPTVQAELEQALSQIANHPVTVTCAGRTDTGVHGTGQVVHFDSDVIRPNKAWVRGTNTKMDHAVRVVWAKVVSDDFHARFSATARHYRYFIYNSPVQPAVMHKGLSWHGFDLDVDRMHRAAQYLVGEQDCTSFQALACQSKSPVRTIHHANVTRSGNIIMLDIKANAFLLHMVRNIVGSLIAIGDSRQPPEWIAQLLAARNRSLAAATAPPNGLYLVDVDYPAEYSLPKGEIGPWFQIG